jgi:hypothetical protein
MPAPSHRAVVARQPHALVPVGLYPAAAIDNTYVWWVGGIGLALFLVAFLVAGTIWIRRR